ncbi:MAG TPA: NAD-dependent epimerase/dehydratase family protein [Synergistaceae bacterium]|nr:NAD-dependent epimerase/dehydratase family protein [Synergistaceae bacterium]
MKILVTGANGFVGSHVVARLQEMGHEALGIVRPSAAFVARIPGVEYAVLQDPYAPEEWGSFVRNRDAVIRLIARTHHLNEKNEGEQALFEKYMRVNLGVTKALVEGMKNEKIKRFLYVSSIKAVGEGSSVPYTEETPCAPQDFYGRSKRETEVFLCGCDFLDVTILRPPLVYGEGVKGNFCELLRAIARQWPLPLGCLSENARSVIYVKNLVDALLLCLQREESKGQIFHVSDQETPSTKDLVTVMGEVLGISPRLVPVPQSVLLFVGAVFGKKDKILKLTGSNTLSWEKISHMLGWKPRFSLKQGLQETVQKFKERGLSS